MGTISDSMRLLFESKESSERYRHFLNNDFHSDVTFFVGSDRKRVPGHSWILFLSSNEFYNIFKLLKLDSYEFIIEDVEYSAFMIFLEYCYTLKVNLDAEFKKTMDVLKLAQRFNLQLLVKICDELIYSMISVNNSMIVYKNKSMFPENSLVPGRVLTNIGNYFTSIMRLQANIDIFVDLPLEAVRDIAKLSPIQCDEMQMFDALMKWAKRNCEKKGIAPSDRHLRTILGDVFYEIRFPIMKSSWFTYIIEKYSEIFTKHEILNICKSLNGSSLECPGFISEPRLPIERSYHIFSIGLGVLFFTGFPNMDNGTTHKMISNFKAKKNRILAGFAFVAKKDEVVNVTSCKLRISNRNWENIETNPDGRCKFNWDYDLISIRFAESREIPATPYDDLDILLSCEFDKLVPNLSSNLPVSQYTVHNDIRKINDRPNAIPYLIIAITG